MARYRRPEDGTRFALARSFLRRTLGRYLRMPAEAVRLETHADGKPRIRMVGSHTDLCFNLSHSRDLALMCVSSALPVGIDVEAVHDIQRLDGLIERCLSAEEQLTLNQSGGDPRLRGFLRFWTRKEAILKGLGSGLSIDPARTSVLHPDRPVLLPEAAGPPERSLAGWSIRDISPADGYLGALAVQGIVREIRMYDDPGLEV